MSHRCIANTACRSADTDSDGNRLGALTPDPDTLCEPCLTHITSCCKQLPKDWQELRAALGERASNSGKQHVKSTPTPAIPISTSKEALMVAIVELADRAAAIVSDTLHADQPDSSHGRRRYCGRFAPHEEVSLQASINIVEPHIDKLATSPKGAHLIWAKDGEQRELTEMSGVDIALAIVDIHNKTRAELGKTRLRHRYDLPCPRCGGEVGRDDGTTIVDCKNEACKASWTEREFKFLQGLIVEGQEKDILRFLLTEAYRRLDDINDTITGLTSDAAVNQSEAVQLIIGAITPALAGHVPPFDRQISTDKATAAARQVDEDNWSWRNEKPYRPPRRKIRKPKEYTGPRIAASSLALDAPIELPGPRDHRGLACKDCNIIHPPGECA